MRGKIAKAIRKVVYRNHSIRAKRCTAIDGVLNCGPVRRHYQSTKKHFNGLSHFEKGVAHSLMRKEIASGVKLAEVQNEP